MDYHIVYLRTPAGDEAIVQRTRIVQRNLRNVLDLVDGKRSVEDIVKKFGDAGIAEAALADLERSGFIETPEGRVQRESQPSPPPPAAPTLQAVEAQARADKGLRSRLHSGFDDEDITVMDPLDFPEPPPVRSAAAPTAAAPPQARSPIDEDDELAELMAAGPPPPLARPRFDEDEHIRGGAAAGFEPEVKPRKKRNWLRYAGYAVAATVLLFVAAVAFFPYETYKPRVEIKLRNALLDPVRIQRMYLNVLPTPGLALENVAIGADESLKVARIRLVPDWLTLFAGVKTIREAVLERPEIDARALPHLMDWLGGGAGSQRYFVAERIRFDNARIRFADLLVEGVTGEVVLDKQGRMASIRFVNGAGNVSGEIEPQGKTFRIRLNATQWTLPAQDWVQLVSLDAEGELGATSLTLSKFDARAFEGIVAGSLGVDWSQGASLDMNLELRKISSAKLVGALKPDLRVSGEMSGTLMLSGRSDALGKIGTGAAAKGNVTIARGVLTNFDLSEAVRARGAGVTRGGQTRFEQLSTAVSAQPDEWQLTGLSLNAGLMQAEGAVALRGKEVAGSMRVAFRGGAEVRAEVGISGTLGDPQLVARR